MPPQNLCRPDLMSFMMAFMTEQVRPPKDTPRDEAAFRAAVAAGIASAEAGRLVSFEKVRDWLTSWGKPGETPAPK